MTLLVSWLWQGVAVAALATLLVRAVSPWAAARRHQLWWLTLLLVLVLPLSGLAQWNASRSTGDTAPGLVAATPAQAAGVPAALLLQSPPVAILALVAGAWVLFVLAGLVRLALGWAMLQRVVASSESLGARERQLATWTRLRTMGRRPALRVSACMRGACAIGLRRPTIVISSDVARSLSDAQLEHVVLHELAHIQRYDDWSTLAQRVVLTFAGFHPAVRWIARKIDLEMESACDECVVVQTGDPREYARSLLDVAQLSAGRSPLRPLIAPGSSTHLSALRARISRLAGSDRRATRVPAGVMSAACMVALVAAAAMASTTPALVAFEDAVFAALPAVASPLRTVGVGVPGPLLPSLTATAGNTASPAQTPVRSARSVSTTDPDERLAPAPEVPFTDAEPSGSGPVAQSEAVGAAEETAVTAEPEPLSARAIAPEWHAQRGRANVDTTPDRSIGAMAQKSAAGITRAAQSTAGAFTRVGQAVASVF